MPIDRTALAVLSIELAERLKLDEDLGLTYTYALPVQAAEEEMILTESSSQEVYSVPIKPTPSSSVTQSSAVSSADISPPAKRPSPFASEGIPPAPPALQDEKMIEVRERALHCQKCGLAATRTNVAFGEGAVPAEIMFIGEGPGRDEDETGRPFVGLAGQFLTRIIEKALEVPRHSVYIANIVKCRAPGNRDPKPEEISACHGFLLEQIRIVKPKIIIAVGKPAANTLLENTEAIGKMRGIWYTYEGVPLRVIYHPSYLLRKRGGLNGKATEDDRKTWEDIKEVKKKLATLKEGT